uniref:Uncharacterized protein n=1 Tax=Glossina pallidipes TaxID=7398 RepID=A0A1A9ZFE0_GLOPL
MENEITISIHRIPRNFALIVNLSRAINRFAPRDDNAYASPPLQISYVMIAHEERINHWPVLEDTVHTSLTGNEYTHVAGPGLAKKISQGPRSGKEIPRLQIFDLVSVVEGLRTIPAFVCSAASTLANSFLAALLVEDLMSAYFVGTVTSSLVFEGSLKLRSKFNTASTATSAVLFSVSTYECVWSVKSAERRFVTFSTCSSNFLTLYSTGISGTVFSVSSIKSLMDGCRLLKPLSPPISVGIKSSERKSVRVWSNVGSKHNYSGLIAHYTGVESFLLNEFIVCFGGEGLSSWAFLGLVLGVLQHMEQILVFGSLTNVQNSHSHSWSGVDGGGPNEILSASSVSIVKVFTSKIIGKIGNGNERDMALKTDACETCHRMKHKIFVEHTHRKLPKDYLNHIMYISISNLLRIIIIFTPHNEPYEIPGVLAPELLEGGLKDVFSNNRKSLADIDEFRSSLEPNSFFFYLLKAQKA